VTLRAMKEDGYNTVESCNEAVADFRRDNEVTAELSLIPGAGAFWKK